MTFPSEMIALLVGHLGLDDVHNLSICSYPCLVPSVLGMPRQWEAE